MFVGTTVGLFTTDQPDSNTIWALEAGIGNVVINHMDYRTYDGKMIVGTHGNGVYSTNLTPAFASTAESSVAHSALVYPTITTDMVNISAEKSERVEIYNLVRKIGDYKISNI
ncbi:MAG: hypothetical protein IPO32_19460 [Crocinitomicaceae bacterium]|nr:hypothetical protein [Crocinitomicaceae bacterium]